VFFDSHISVRDSNIHVRAKYLEELKAAVGRSMGHIPADSLSECLVIVVTFMRLHWRKSSKHSFTKLYFLRSEKCELTLFILGENDWVLVNLKKKTIL
jgi:hypothetical protein